MKLTLDGVYNYQVEGFGVNLSIDLCRKLFPVVVSQCCDIVWRKDRSGVRHEKMVS